MLSVALYNVRSLYNVGSVFRTSSGAGVGMIYLAGYTGHPPHKRLSKVALGTEDEVPYTICRTVGDLIGELAGHYVIALEQHPMSRPYWEIDPPAERPTTLVVGNEILGMDQRLVERADAIAEIPMAGRKESLNVASAFATVAYDLGHKLGTVTAGNLHSRRAPKPPREGVLTEGQTTDGARSQ